MGGAWPCGHTSSCGCDAAVCCCAAALSCRRRQRRHRRRRRRRRLCLGCRIELALGARPGSHTPPQMRCYDVAQLSMKFDRHLDAEIVDFQILSEDYSKAVFLCADRRWAAAAVWCCGAGSCGRAGGRPLGGEEAAEGAAAAVHAAAHSPDPCAFVALPPYPAHPIQSGLPRSICFHARFGAYYKTRVPKFGRDLAYCPFSAELLVAASAPEVRGLACWLVWGRRGQLCTA